MMFRDKLKKYRKSIIIQLLLLVAFAFIPIIVKNIYVIHILILSNLYAIFAASWDLISGYTGQVSLGHAAFFGGGAYFSAFLTMYGVSPYFCILISGICMVAIGLIVGVPCLRLSGPYLAIVTLAFSETIRALVIAFPGVTHGDEGLPLKALIRGVEANYYLSLFSMFIFVNIISLIANHYFRLPFIAIRENETAARASGINVTKYRLFSFLFSAFFAGICGSLYGFYMMAITPDALSIDMSMTPLTMAVVGGMGTITGPIIGSYILVLLTESLRILIYRIRLLIYAALTVVFLMVMPGGIYKALKDLLKRVFNLTS